MTRPYRLTPLAETDLEEIVDYSLMHFGVTQTLKLKDAIDKAMVAVGEDPGIGHTRSDLVPEDDADIRFFTVKRTYRIVYRPDTRPVEVVRVLHGARDVRSKL